MDKIIFICIIIIVCLLIICYLKNEEKFINPSLISTLSPAEKDMLSEEFVKINKEKYLKYKEDKNNILKNTDFEIGYNKLDGTNEESVGFCPLGEYYKGVFTGNYKDVFTKCKKCFKCNKLPGYFYKGGCIGDKDSVCEFKKLPHDLYLKAHTFPYTIHSQISQHKHQYINENNAPMYSNVIHKHSV